MDTLLFLGAGASVPFGMPTTKQFKERLLAMPESKDQGIMKELLRVSNYKDIEHVLRGIEDIENMGERGKSFLNSLKATDKQYLKLDFGKMLEELDICRKNINKYVYEFYSFDKNKIEMVRTHYDSLLKNIEGKINIVTTNYDRILEKYVISANGKNFCDGFKYDANMDERIFHQDNFDENINDVNIINIYKLHGSLNWKKIDGDIIRQDKEEQNRVESENILIYPTLDPKDGLDVEPFASINDKFKVHMGIVDVCVVVGYSFRDSHINDIFKEFVKSGKELIIISPTVESDLKDIDFISDKNSTLINNSAIGINVDNGLRTDYEERNQSREKKKMLEARMNDIKNHNPLDGKKYLDTKKELDITIDDLLRLENNYNIESRPYSALLHYDEFKNIHKIQMDVESLISTFILKFILESISTH